MRECSPSPPGVNREKLAETITVCLEEAEKMASELIPEEELRKAKDHTIGRFRLGLETAHSLGQRHGEQLLTRGEIESIEEYVERIEAISRDQVCAVGRRVIDRKNCHCSVVGPNLDADEILAALA